MHRSISIIASVLLFSGLSACAAEPADNDGGAGSGPVGQAGSSSTGGAVPTSGGAPASVAGSPGTSGSGGVPPVGVAGTGGAPPAGCEPVGAASVLSDFDMGVADVLPHSGRDGSWFLYNDKSPAGVQTPVKVVNMPLVAEAGGACGTAYAFHTTGMGFSGFGAGFGMDFMKKVDMLSVAHDLRMYSGIALRAKAAATTPLRVSISDFNTAPEGMVCVDTADTLNKERCGDYFGAEIVLGPEYQDFPIKFVDMKQRGWGKPIATGFDKARAYTVRMQVKGSAQAPATFDLWVDDIRLVP